MTLAWGATATPDTELTVPARTADTVAYGIISAAWDLYRSSQRLPASGDLIEARAAVFTAAEPYASGRRPVHEADLAKIQDARQRLTEAVARRGEAFMATGGKS